LAIANPFSAELMAHQGFDAVTVDLQHGPVDFQAAVGMLAAISTTPAVPMARVPWNEPILTAKLLDAGAYGVICPMINPKAEAEALVGACRYPPRGARSFGPNRALLYGGADYWQHANDEVLVFAMIETREAVKNLDEIVSLAIVLFVAFDIRCLDVIEGKIPAFLIAEFGHPLEKIGVERRLPRLHTDKADAQHLWLLLRAPRVATPPRRREAR